MCKDCQSCLVFFLLWSKDTYIIKLKLETLLLSLFFSSQKCVFLSKHIMHLRIGDVSLGHLDPKCALWISLSLSNWKWDWCYLRTLEDLRRQRIFIFFFSLSSFPDIIREIKMRYRNFWWIKDYITYKQIQKVNFCTLSPFQISHNVLKILRTLKWYHDQGLLSKWSLYVRFHKILFTKFLFMCSQSLTTE